VEKLSFTLVTGVLCGNLELFSRRRVRRAAAVPAVPVLLADFSTLLAVWR